MKSLGEETFLLHVRAEKLPVPSREYRFDAENGRRWRFDFAFVDQKVAVEIEGGTWGTSRHSTGAGYRADTRKYNEATRQGWSVYRFVTSDVMSGYAIEYIKGILECPTS